MKEKILGIILIFATYFSESLSQKQLIRFDHYTTEQGLSQNMVDCILRDHKGFIWVGTWNGLNRFDGYSFLWYKHDNTKNSISDNFVRSICQDKAQNLWIGTRKGLNLYLYKSNKFINYYSTNDRIKLFSDEINVVFCDSKGYLWVGTTNGLTKFTLDDKSNIINAEYFKAGLSEKNLSHNVINCIYEDSRQNIWVGTQVGLNRFDNHTNRWIKMMNDPYNENSISSNTINAIYEDKLGDIWIGTEIGLNRLSINNFKIERYYFNPDDRKSLAHNVVRDIVEDLKGNIIIGTLGGISTYNRFNNNFINYKHELHNKYGLNNDFVNCLLSDKEGNLWIGTEKGGINKYNVYQHQFEIYVNELSNPNSINNNTINSLFEDDNYLWIGTAGGGLNVYNKKNQKFYHFRYDAHRANSISSDFISAIYKDKEGNIWLGTWGSGLNLIKKGQELNGNFIHFFPDGTPNSLPNAFISSIIEDKEGRLLIGTIGGLIIKEKNKNIFKTFIGRGKETINRIGCLLFDIQENLWVGTENGLFQIIPASNGLIDPQQSLFNIFRNIPGNENSLSGNYIISICSDSKGRLWFGTYGNGLNLMIPSENADKIKFKVYNENNGLSNNVIYGILEDENNNLWLSNDNGLTKFNPDKNLVKCYYETDGLPSNQFYWSAYFKNTHGKMYFGSLNGLIAFFPSQIQDDPFPPKIVFTDFKIFNSSVEVGKKYYGKIILSSVIAEVKDIILSYKANEFSIEFSALHYNKPIKNQYQYKLEGFDNNWSQVDSRRRYATYTNLKGGEYIFRVKASNNDGVWSSSESVLNIKIIPPFWATWWFRGLIIILVISSIIAYNRIRLYTLEQHKAKLERMVEQRTAQIENQKRELLQQAELLSQKNNELIERQQLIEGQKLKLEIKNAEIIEQRNRLMELNKKVQLAQKQQLRLFTHISHEFRTPLTLIISPLEQLLSERLPNHLNNSLQSILKNAQRLLHLVDQIMELRKIESGKSDLQLVETDIIHFINEIALSFNAIAKEKKLNFSIHHQVEKYYTAFDKDKIENIVYNLLSNAFKYTPENKTIFLFTQIIENSNIEQDEYLIIAPANEKLNLINKYLEIRVIDEGIGISSDQIKDIFKRFHRLNTPYLQKTKGTGIGLYITREMIKEHYGFLFVKSKIDEGSTFRVLIPSTAFYQKINLPINEINNLSFNKKDSSALIIPQYFSDNKEIKINHAGEATILILDDDLELLTFMNEQLSKTFKVITSSHGKEGLKLANIYIPDVIICDVMMPETDGIEICNQLKNNLTTSHIPVILLSAKAEVENFIEGLEQGADDYIAKPFNLSVLTAKIRSLIENRERLKKKFQEQIFPDAKEITNNKADEKFIEKALYIVREHLNDADFTVEDFAKEMCVSRSLLHKKLTAITGQSANEFILSLRMKKALALLQTNDLSISEIAYQVGFNDPKYFSKCFKKYYGRSPSEV